MSDQSSEFSLTDIPVESASPSTTHPKIEFTTLTAQVPVGKTISVDGDGNKRKSSGKGVPSGTLTRKTAHGLAHLSRLLDEMTSHQFVTWGVTASGRDGRMVTKARAQAGAAGISRTKGNFAWPAGPGVMLLDYDARKGHDPIGQCQWRAILASVCPSLASVGMLARPSTSSGVEGLEDGGGIHTYIVVERAADIPEIGRRLTLHLWAAGHGYVKVSKAGTPLERTLVDDCVWQPERQDYVGPPELIDVTRNAPDPFLRAGPMLTLADVPELTDEQEDARQVNLRAARKAVEQEMEDAIEAWIAERVEQGMSEEDARQVLKTRRLTAATPIEMVDGRRVTVAAILAEPHEFHDMQCLDPIEEDERGVAVVYALPGEKNLPPMIVSYKNGKTVYHMKEKAEKAKSASEKKAPKPRACGWELREGKGVFAKKKVEGEDVLEHVCSELTVLARTEDVTGRDGAGNDGVLIELRHQREHDMRQIWLPMSRVHSPIELKLALTDAGLWVNTAVQTHTALLSRYINENLPDKWVDASEKTGWCKGSFALPGGTIGAAEIVLQSSGSKAEYAPGGTFEGWRQTARLSTGNPLAVLAISCAFVAPLLRPLGISGSGMHFHGDSSSGKSTCGEWAASVWGGEGYTHKWNATAGGLEGLALSHNDTLLYLDEIARADADVLAASIYALADGKGREKLNKDSTPRPAPTWRVFVLSTGEKTAEAYCARSRVDLDAGQDIRMLNVEVAAAHGAFDELHGHENGEALALAVKAGITSNYGHAGRAFVSKVIQEASADDLTEALAQVKREFDAIPGQESRAARVFAAVALAGELAAQWGIVPWREGEAIQAAVKAFSTWKGDRASAGGTGEDARILDKIAAVVSAHGATRFQGIESSEGVRDQLGYWDTDGASRRFYLFTGSGLKEATAGYAKKRVLQALEKAGAILKTESNGPNRKPRADVKTMTPGGSYDRLYCVAPWMLSGDAELAVPAEKVPLTIVK